MCQSKYDIWVGEDGKVVFTDRKSGNSRELLPGDAIHFKLPDSGKVFAKLEMIPDPSRNLFAEFWKNLFTTIGGKPRKK